MRRCIISLLACLAVLTTSADDRTLVRGEYWTDDQYGNRTSVTISNGEMNFEVDASALSEGVHRLNVRVLDSEDYYSPILSWVFYRLAPEVATGSDTLEYWVDSGARQTHDITNSEASFVLDAANLSEGLHTLNYRVTGTASYQSPVQSWAFYRTKLTTEQATHVQEYEYWMDNNYGDKHTGSVMGDEVEFSLDASTLGEGVHTLNYRVKDDLGNYSPTQSWMFFRNESLPTEGTISIEYWINEQAHQTKEIAGADSLSFAVDASQLDEGVHTLYYRIHNTNGENSPTQAWKFYCVKDIAGGVGISWYQTWWNDRTDLAEKAKVYSDSSVYELDRQFSVPVYASYFCNENADKAKFSIQMGGTSDMVIGEDSVEVTRTGVEFYAIKESDIPNALKELQATPSVKLTFGSDIGWEYSEANKLGILTYSVTGNQQPTDADGKSYNIETRHRPQQGSYYVFTPTVSGALRAGLTIDANKAFYVINGNTGEPMTEFDLQDTTGKIAELKGGTDGSFSTLANQLTGVCTVNVDAGTPYYIFTNDAQLRFYGFEFYKDSVDINPATTAAIRDSIQQAQSITPIITLAADSSTISIRCRYESGVIYYTTDGTDPVVADSLRYKEPIPINHNCTIKAICLVDGVISPLSAFVVKWFKVADVLFSHSGYHLSMKTKTTDAKIYYTTDGSVPTPQTTEYQDTLSLTEDCMVKAIAVKADFNDSEVTEYTFSVDSATTGKPKIVCTDSVVTITAALESDIVYYTLNGSIPTKKSALYTSPFRVDHNCVVKAIAMRKDYFDSKVDSLSIDLFKVAKPVLNCYGYRLSMKTETTDTKIYYTTNGSVPTPQATEYQDTLSLTEDCMIKAIAVKANFNDSEIAEYTFSVDSATTEIPKITCIDSIVTITAASESDVVYYTLNGSKPTKESILYTKPFRVERNCMVKAIAVRKDYFDSREDSLNINIFKVATPTFSVDGITLTINCATPGATTYYSIGKDETPSTASMLYTGPFVLNDNQPVKAIAIREGYNDSEIALFEEHVVTSQSVTFAYNGRFLKITPVEKNAIVYYTLDGSDPTVDSEVYTKELTIDRLLTVKAAAMRPYTNLSPVESMEVTYVYDGHDVLVKNAGQLAKALEWKEPNEVKELHISGPVDETDLQTIRQLPNLLTLDMEKVQLEGQALPDNALQGCNMRWFVSPTNLESVGKQAFADCQHLAAITWNTKVELTAEVFGTNHNPNMLYYVPSENIVRIDSSNVVSNGRARSIVLRDGTEFSDFFCPKAFYAVDISYVRDFKMKTQKSICQGWEALALPFAVQTITHWKNGELVPFAAKKVDDNRKPFWLAQLENGKGFVSTDAIMANVPYIISMPNDSTVYGDRNLLAGKVTFSSKNVDVPVTDVESTTVVMGDVYFIANYSLQQPSDNIYALNLYKAYDATHSEGSIFLPNYRQLRPFEAYTGSNSVQAPLFIAFDELIGFTTDIEGIQTELGCLDQKIIKVYDLNGLLIKAVSNMEELNQLPKGIYLVNDRKVVIK